VGYLQTQNYTEGDPIKKGDLLFEIDPRPFKALLDQAKGQLAQAEARLGKTELDVKRYAPLVKDRAISQEEYDDAVQANLEAQAAVVAAKAQVEQSFASMGANLLIIHTQYDPANSHYGVITASFIQDRISEDRATWVVSPTPYKNAWWEKIYDQQGQLTQLLDTNFSITNAN